MTFTNLIFLKNKLMATKIYQGTSTNSSNLLYTLDKGKIYNGSLTTVSHEIKSIPSKGLTIVDFTKVYKGTVKTSPHQILSIKGDKIYKGTVLTSSHQVAKISGDRISDDDFEKVIYLLAQKNNLL